MELGAGNYKQSEYGPIPNDWIIAEFQDVIDGFSSGQTPSRAKPEFYNGEIPWITSGELNYNVITDTKEKITKEGVQDALLKTIPVGTFLFAITGLEAAGTRGSCALTGIEATTNQSCMALYPKNGILTTPYVYHFYVGFGNEIALKYCQGTKQQSFTAGIVKKLPIIVPPTIEEQKAITQVLSDFDSLIDGLERLIAKKRGIKEGVMQELLRPKEGWELLKIRDIGETYGGLMSKSKKDFESGNALYITFMNVMQHPIVNLDKLEYVSVSTNEKQNLVQKGDLLFNGSSETPEEIGMCSLLNQEVPLLYLNSFCFGFRLKSQDRVYPLFLTYYFRSGQGRQLLYSSAQGATRYNLSKKNFNDLILPIPPINSQQDIARTIYDLDSELNLIEISIKKWKSIREGVMNQLLTGKIRLV